MKKAIRIMNSCKAILSDKNWNIIKEEINNNVTCNVWRNSIAQRLINWPTETSKLWVIQILAIWTWSTPALENDTSLEVETERIEVDLSTATINDTVIVINWTFPIWTAWIIQEAGVFTDSTALVWTPNSGSILAHSVFTTPVTKLVDQSLTIQWTISILNTL